MRYASITRRLTRRRAQLTIFSGLVALCLLAVTFLGTQVFMKLDDYASASQDNVPWSLSQLEVDQLKLLNALRALEMGQPETLTEVNRRFDAFYSRVGIVAVGRVYDPIHQDEVASKSLKQLQDQVFAMEQIIDSPDIDITTEQDQLIDLVMSTTEPIRRIAVFGISMDAAMKQRERDALTSKLIQVTVLSLLLLAAMASLGLLLWQLYRLYRQRAKENRQTLHRLSTILETSQDAVLVVHPDGSVIDTNRAANDMFFAGNAPEDTQPISGILKRKTDDGSLSGLSGEKLLASCRDGPNLCANLIAEAADGHQFPVELSADTAMRGGQNVVICFLRDISRRLADQAALLDARDKALSGEKAKARFLGAISHEMRTPLTGILGALDLLDDTPLTPQQRTYAQIMQSSGSILLNQINDALDMAQTDQASVELASDTFDLDIFLDTLLRSQRPMAQRRGNTLKLSLADGSLGRVLGDRDRLYQVILNLVSNAIKFTQNGDITVEACRMIRADGRDGDLVEIQVADTGIGIAPDDQARIFEDFVRLDQDHAEDIEGTGLGLGIVRNLVVLMGGDIGVESELGQGSLFWVRLPLPSTDMMAQAETSQGSSISSGPMDILVVEDNDINRQVLVEMLEKDQHRVWMAENGAVAVEMARAQRFDTILMDLNMPEMDGITAAGHIRADGASQSSRIIALSAHLSAAKTHEVLEAGMDAALTKPLRREALWQVVSATQTASTQMQILDETVIAQLTDALDPGSLHRLLEGFYMQGQALLADLPDLEGEELPARLHDFAGLSATVGAQALHARLTQAEVALRAGDGHGAETAMESLPGLWKDTCVGLDRFKAAA